MKHLFRYTTKYDYWPSLTGRRLIHGSVDAQTTLCEKTITDRWVIITNEFDGEITCPKCIRWDKKAFVNEMGLYSNASKTS